MWKDKVFIESVAYPRFPRIFHFRQADRVCRFCKKTFCCAKCHDRHVDKVHPNVQNADCSLCASEILPMRPCESAKLNLEDEKLLCHIVDKHLPLRCRLCGDLFESREDFKSIAACKWFERWHCLTSPISHEHLEKKLKQCSTSESDYNGSRFYTPPEIYRKTSTPMFVGQKAFFETPCVPNFSLKTPKTNSPSIVLNGTISKTQTSETQFFSYLLHASNEGMTPFRISKDEQFFRSNSGRKLSIMEEQEKTGYTTANAIEAWTPVNMDLTKSEGGILQDSPKSDDNREDVVKKVRFSDQYKTATELGNLMESCARTILNKSTEEEEFHDVHDVTNAQKAKTIEDIKDAKNTVDTNSTEDTSIVENATNTSDSQAEDRRRSLKPSENCLSDSQIRIIRDNTKNINKENRDPEVSNESSSTTNQRDSNRVLMMVLVENNSGGLTTDDLMPLINSGLKKLQEQLTSANCPSPSSAVESAKVCRRSITMRMSVSSVESYSANGAATMTNHGQLASSSSSLSVRRGENNVTRNNGGFLSAITQMMKCTLRNVAGLRIPPRRIETTEVQRQEIVEELASSQGSSSGASQARPSKRAREATDVSSEENPIALALDIQSPLAKRQRVWYKMIRGRQPISRMRNNRVITSPRGVSAETQVFSQGSLTVGDMVLPLPTRAHQSKE